MAISPESTDEAEQAQRGLECCFWLEIEEERIQNETSKGQKKKTKKNKKKKKKKNQTSISQAEAAAAGAAAGAAPTAVPIGTLMFWFIPKL